MEAESVNYDEEPAALDHWWRTCEYGLCSHNTALNLCIESGNPAQRGYMLRRQAKNKGIEVKDMYVSVWLLKGDHRDPQLSLAVPYREQCSVIRRSI